MSPEVMSPETLVMLHEILVMSPEKKSSRPKKNQVARKKIKSPEKTN